ncbi:murein biosynthesis integral membrane protein MurJ [Benzoatithermus flavus]|uniref:Lipid II flippase MurJ n=1 Tax=Benzoatithermus flavus TaxID=3108223 RepID=A0ABU8XKZ7_9PROT
MHVEGAEGDLEHSKPTSLAADTRTVTVWILISRISGFARMATVAAVLGPTFFCNLYQTAALLPSTLYGLLTGTLLAQLLVPPLVRHLDARNRDAARRVVCGFLGVAVLIFSLILALSLALAPLLLGTIAAGTEIDAAPGWQIQVGWPLLAMLMPQIILYAIAGIGGAVQQAHGRFAFAAAAPVLENIGTTLVLLLSAYLFGTGTTLVDITLPQLTLLGLGTTAAVALHAFAQWWGARRVGITLLPRAGWRDPEVRRILKTGINSGVYTSLYWAVFLVLLLVAGSVPGGTVAFQIGYSLFQLPIALAATPLATAQLPRLSRSFSRGDLAEFATTFRTSLALMSFVAIPISLLLVTMPETLAHAAAFGAMGGAEGVALLTACIGSLGLGVISEAAIVISTSACYARYNSNLPLRATAVRLAIVLAGVLATMAVPSIGRLWMLGIIFSAANLVAAVYLYRAQDSTLPQAPAPIGRELLTKFLLAAIAISPGLLVAYALGGAVGTSYQSMIAALTAGILSALCYLAIHWLRGSRELALLLPARLQGLLAGRLCAAARVMPPNGGDPLPPVSAG